MSKWLNRVWNFEMKEEKVSLRKQTFKALGVFFVLMILFTLLSRAASTLTMAEVTVERPGRRTLDHFVRQEGTIEVDEVRGVFAKSGLVIDQVNVSLGATVEVGTPLITVKMSYLSERIAELETRLQIVDLQISDSLYNQSLEYKRRYLEQNRAREDYNHLVAVQDQQVTEAFIAMENAWLALVDFINQPVYEDEVEAHREMERSLRDAYDSAWRAYQTALTAREGQLRLGERQIEDANAPASQNSAVEIAKLERNSIETTLQSYLALYEANGVIYSPMDGIVTSLDSSVVVGGFTPQTAIMHIADVNAGYVFIATIGRDEQKHVSIGDQVTLELARGDRIADLHIETITRNPQDDEKMDVLVRVPINDNIRLYDMATMIVAGEARIFSTTIPLAALHKGGPGEPDFVLVVREENTILGSQMVVDRVAVTVQDKNHDFAAIGDHELTSEQQFVVFSERPVTAGDRVLVSGE